MTTCQYGMQPTRCSIVMQRCAAPATFVLVDDSDDAHPDVPVCEQHIERVALLLDPFADHDIITTPIG